MPLVVGRESALPRYTYKGGCFGISGLLRSRCSKKECFIFTMFLQSQNLFTEWVSILKIRMWFPTCMQAYRYECSVECAWVYIIICEGDGEREREEVWEGTRRTGDGGSVKSVKMDYWREVRNISIDYWCDVTIVSSILSKDKFVSEHKKVFCILFCSVHAL